MRRAAFSIAVTVVVVVAAMHFAQAANLRHGVEQFLPHRPPDGRAKQAQQLIAARRFAEAEALLDGYVSDRPEDGDARIQLGWCRYRLGKFEEAKTTFAAALERDPRSDDARVGLGYTLVQTEGGNAGARLFREVLLRDATHRDALEGMVLAGRRPDVSRAVAREALDAARRLEALSTTFRPELLPAGSEKRLRGAAPDTTPILIPARAIKDNFEIDDGGTWRPIFIAGFNLGAALPGRFPSEFPTDEKLYAQWFEAMASMGANAIRLYTLLPPEFYRSLKAYNASHPTGRLWLIQGVWTELPPKFDFSDPAYIEEFNAETARVIDAVHGNLVLGPRPGHAFGVYNADASSSVLAYIIGREWEPFAVAEHNKIHAATVNYAGTYFQVTNGRAMECWVASVCEFAASREATMYREIHPLTFSNWPTLDPLSHPTESTRTEEDYWRERYGISFPKVLRSVVWEDDAVTLDSTLIHATSAMPAGFFASYHIYPNFPDFMNLDPQYDVDPRQSGQTRYGRYLAALKAYHGDQPVLVAEFGMSTSRGVGHLQPQGWNHGGVSEKRQGEFVSRMLREIHENRYAGGVVFEFLDEWFKSTWSVAPFESPSDHRRMWFNAESPEESYGIMASRPGSARIRLDGRSDDWQRVPVLYSK
jgi:tetratricopeptide (TPR) repeat protein